MPLIALHGPTGSGKTDVAVRIARALGTEVVNCDPAQCYRGLPILTNTPTPEHDAIAPHRLIALWELDHESSVAEFAAAAHREIDELVAATGWAVACSGSGLYLRAAITELEWGGAGGSVPADAPLREALGRRYVTEGGAALHAELATIDAPAAARIHPNDRKRVIRALEVARVGGSVAPAGASLWDSPHRRPTHAICLAIDRGLVRERIDGRTRAMFAAGVLDEVAGVVGRHGEHVDRLSWTARMLHGLADCVDVLAGTRTADESIERIAARTRQYAKRQDTWARRWPGAHRVAVESDPDQTAARCIQLVR